MPTSAAGHFKVGDEVQISVGENEGRTFVVRSIDPDETAENSLNVTLVPRPVSEDKLA